MPRLKDMKITILHHPEYRQTERLRLLVKQETFRAEQACLTKYFPKYYRRLKTEISMKAWSLISKLQRIKTIGHFTCPRVDEIPRTKATKALRILEQRIFRNKRKSTISVPLLATHISFIGVKGKPARLSRFCPMITSLNLTKIKGLNLGLEKVGFVDRKQELRIFSCYYYFWRSLRNLKHLELSNKTLYSWFILKEIDSSPLFLSHLKTLKFSLILPIEEMNLAHPRNVLKELAKNKNFLRHLTHLDCENFEGCCNYDGFISTLLGQCPNLVSLNFPIGREAHRYSSPDEIYKECQDTGALEQIRKMDTLQELTVSVYGIRTFIKHLPFPRSLQKIVLNVLHSFYDPSLLDLFDPEFFERWRELSHLRILKIKMRRIAKSNDLLLKFVLPLLQMTPNLKRFRFELAYSPAFHVSSCEAFSLSLFNHTMATLRQLESFKISNDVKNHYSLAETVDNLITYDPKKCQFLLNLRMINIVGQFSEKFNFQDFSQLFSGACEKKIKMSTFVFDSAEALSEHIKTANCVSSLRNINLELKMMLMTENLEEISSSLKGPIVLEHNLAVDLNICWKPKDWGIDAKAIIAQNMDALGRIFANFDLKITRNY